MFSLGYQVSSLASLYDFPGYVITAAIPVITEVVTVLADNQQIITTTSDRALRPALCYDDRQVHTVLHDDILTVSIEVYLK